MGHAWAKAASELAMTISEQPIARSALQRPCRFTVLAVIIRSCCRHFQQGNARFPRFISGWKNRENREYALTLSVIPMASATWDWESRIGRRVRLRDLHILSAVVRSGSMAKAASHLGDVAVFRVGGDRQP